MNQSVSILNPGISKPQRWLALLGGVCRVVVALVFLFAGVLKSFNPEGFAYQIESYGIIAGSLTHVAAIFFIVIEIVLAVALLINYKPRIAIPGTGILLLFFIFVTAWAWANGKTEGCGCFGNLASRTPGEVIVEDVFLLAGLSIAWLSTRSDVFQNFRWKNQVFYAGLVLAIVFPFAGPYLPVDSIVTSLKVGADLRELSVSDIDVDLTQGEYLVVLLGENCSLCENIVEDLNQLTTPQVVGIFIGDRDQSFEFLFKYGVAFTLGYAPREEFGHLYRTLPRIFLLKEGIVDEVLDGVPDIF